MNPLLFTRSRPAAGGAGFPAMFTTATEFDGTNDSQARGGNLTDITSSKEATFGLWVKFNASKDLINQTIFTSTSNRFLVSKNTTNTVQFALQTSASANIRSSSNLNFTLSSADGWVGILLSVNTATQTLLAYKGNTKQAPLGTITLDALIDFAGVTNWTFCGASRLAGCVCCVTFHNKFVNLDSTAIRRKFITAAGLPVDISLSDPFGETPLIWCPSGDLTVNDGGGGPFVTTGALTACPDSPNPAP